MTLAYLPSRRKNYYHHFFWIPRGETRRGDGGPLKAVAAPLTPRPRGTIYEDLLFILERRVIQDERGLSKTLQPQYVCNLAVVARPAAAISRAPTIAREARRPTRGTPEENE